MTENSSFDWRNSPNFQPIEWHDSSFLLCSLTVLCSFLMRLSSEINFLLNISWWLSNCGVFDVCLLVGFNLYLMIELINKKNVFLCFNIDELVCTFFETIILLASETKKPSLYIDWFVNGGMCGVYACVYSQCDKQAMISSSCNSSCVH